LSRAALALEQPVKGEKDFQGKRMLVVAVNACKSFNEGVPRGKVCSLEFLVMFASSMRLPSLIHDL
jgi:hypothetical protein